MQSDNSLCAPVAGPQRARVGALVLAFAGAPVLAAAVYAVPLVLGLPDWVSQLAPGLSCAPLAGIHPGDAAAVAKQALGEPLDVRRVNDGSETWVYAAPKAWYLFGGVDAVVTVRADHVESTLLQLFDETVVARSAYGNIDKSATETFCASTNAAQSPHGGVDPTRE